MSMSGLEIGIAGIASIPIDMVHFQVVCMLAAQATIGALPVLPFDQGGQSEPDRWVASAPCTPIHPIPILRTPIARNLHVP
jgi:hypothetical protein